MKRIFVVALTVVLVGITNSLFADSKSDKIAELKRQIAELEQDSKTEISPGKKSKVKDKANITSERMKAKNRMRQDWNRYSRKQLKQIENLYKSRGYKYGSTTKTKNLLRVISQYSYSNRAGCAMLYLGQSHTGNKQKYYLKKSMSKYKDCFYGNGVQVGAYAMYWLAVRVYLQEGKKAEAYTLLKQLKKKYPNAIDHRGNNLAPQIDKILDTEQSQ